jgi:hypothetical protein
MSFSLLGGIGSELISSVATAQQPPSAGNARGKSTKELAMQCIVELATVTVATSGLVAAVQKRNIPEIIGRVTLLTTGLATASNMCDEAISQGFEQLSEHFDSPEKSGIHNIEELRYIDYTPDPDPKIKVA